MIPIPFGMQNAKIIVPGDPYRSVLMYRTCKLGYARMPYIGSRVVDSSGMALLEAMRKAPASEYLLVEPSGQVYGVLAARDLDGVFSGV